MARIPTPRAHRDSLERSDRDLLARIARSAGSKAGYKQLIRELGLGGGRERRLLVEQLTRLVARGELARLGEDMWAIPKRETIDKAAPTGSGAPAGTGRWDGMEAAVRGGRDRLVSGRLDLHRDGFGFVRPDAIASRNKANDGDLQPQTGLKAHHQLSRYLLVTGICIILNYLFLKLFINYFGLYPTPAKILTTVFVIVFSYVSQTYIFFRARPPE